MDLSHEFVVRLPVEEAWVVLTDLERVAPCMPGAQLDEVEGEEYRGRVRVKVGPITVEYKGTASFLERDVAAHTAVLRAQGRETKGQGNASATVRATLVSIDSARTKVNVETALNVAGRVAQYGRGALSDVSAKLLGQFVDNLEKDLAASGSANETAGPISGNPPTETSVGADPEMDSEPETDGEPETSSDEGLDNVRRINSAPSEPVRLVGLVGSTLTRRLVGLVAAVLLAVGIVGVVRQRRR